MRILHLISDLSPRSGGPPKACFEMARAVSRCGHDVWIYTTNYGLTDAVVTNAINPKVKDGVNIVYFPSSFPRFWGTSWSMFSALINDLKKFDIVHIHSMYLFHNLVGSALCRFLGVPYILRPHGILDPYIFKRHRFRKWIMEVLFERRNLHKANYVHFVSEEEMQLADTVMRGLSGKVIPLGLDLEDYSNLPLVGKFREKFPQIGSGEIVLFLGRISFKKGLDLLIPAFKLIEKDLPKAMLVIAGPDDEGTGNVIKRLISEHQLESRVVFTGNLSGSDKLSAFVDASVFVLPSYSENFGIAVIEAMACGTPVVVSDKVNIHREVTQAGAGEVVSLSIEEIAAAIRNILSSKNLSRSMGIAGRKLVETKFSWKEISKSLEELYLSIASNAKKS